MVQDAMRREDASGRPAQQSGRPSQQSGKANETPRTVCAAEARGYLEGAAVGLLVFGAGVLHTQDLWGEGWGGGCRLVGEEGGAPHEGPRGGGGAGDTDWWVHYAVQKAALMMRRHPPTPTPHPPTGTPSPPSPSRHIESSCGWGVRASLDPHHTGRAGAGPEPGQGLPGGRSRRRVLP